MAMDLSDLLLAVKALAPTLTASIARGASTTVSQFADLNQAAPNEIAFLANAKYAKQLTQSQAGAMVLSEAHWVEHQNSCRAQGVVLCSHPYAFFAFASQVLQSHKQRLRLTQQSDLAVSLIHPSACIDANAHIGHAVRIGAFCVIGAQAVIEDGAVLDHHVVVSDCAYIGSQTHLYSHVTVHAEVRIGQRCIVHSGTVLGADGFGFAPYQQQWVKIPQTGTVRVGDDVEIGANCTIDRGALGDTVIGLGSKLDNLIQIAHNVQIGEHCAFAANVAIAGSAIIGNRVQMGGKAGVLGHISICDDAVISSCTLVTKSINKPAMYTGVYPIQENAEWEKNAVSLKRLNTLREQIKQLEKRLDTPSQAYTADTVKAQAPQT